MKAATIHPNTKLAAMIFCSGVITFFSIYKFAQRPAEKYARYISYRQTNEVELNVIHETASVLNDATL
jgi:hypothetical protein